jgi:hypothetical protein
MQPELTDSEFPLILTYLLTQCAQHHYNTGTRISSPSRPIKAWSSQIFHLCHVLYHSLWDKPKSTMLRCYFMVELVKLLSEESLKVHAAGVNKSCKLQFKFQDQHQWTEVRRECLAKKFLNNPEIWSPSRSLPTEVSQNRKAKWWAPGIGK